MLAYKKDDISAESRVVFATDKNDGKYSLKSIQRGYKNNVGDHVFNAFIENIIHSN